MSKYLNTGGEGKGKRGAWEEEGGGGTERCKVIRQTNHVNRCRANRKRTPTSNWYGEFPALKNPNTWNTASVRTSRTISKNSVYHYYSISKYRNFSIESDYICECEPTSCGGDYLRLAIFHVIVCEERKILVCFCCGIKFFSDIVILMSAKYFTAVLMALTWMYGTDACGPGAMYGSRRRLPRKLTPLVLKVNGLQLFFFYYRVSCKIYVILYF